MNYVSLEQDFNQLEQYKANSISILGSGMTDREALANAFGYSDANDQSD